MTLETQPRLGHYNSALNGGTLSDRFVSRSTRITGRTGEPSVFVEPAPHWTSRDVWQALHGYAVARLADARHGHVSSRFANAQHWTDYLVERGFNEEAIVRHQIGLIPSVADARDHLRAVGFSDYDIEQCGFTSLLGASTSGHQDLLFVPVAGVPGQASGFAVHARTDDRCCWKMLFNGSVTADASHLAYDHVVLTTDPLEACALRDAGLTEAYAVPTSRSEQASFWESLAEHGVDRVTLVTAAANGEWDVLRDAAEAACDARCTPAVDLYELPHTAGRSIAFYVKQIGAESFRREISRRLESPQPRYTAPAMKPAFDAVAYWASVRPQLASIKDVHARRQHERLASEVGELLACGRNVNASQAIDAAIEGTGISMLPRSTSHHVEYVRSASARDAMANRLFDLLRTTSGHITIVTPLSYDQFIETIAHHAATATTGSKYGARFAGRTADQLCAELQTFGHRLQIISTPRPVAFTESGSHLIHRTDVILVDATGQAQSFWWQENGWAAHLTELAEQADCDLIAFWAVDRTERRTEYKAELIATMRQFTNFAL